MRTRGAFFVIRYVKGIRFNRDQSQPKRPIFFHACATCSELPPDISTMPLHTMLCYLTEDWEPWGDISELYLDDTCSFMSTLCARLYFVVIIIKSIGIKYINYLPSYLHAKSMHPHPPIPSPSPPPPAITKAHGSTKYPRTRAQCETNWCAIYKAFTILMALIIRKHVHIYMALSDMPQLHCIHTYCVHLVLS